jgi:hypothetical protein
MSENPFLKRLGVHSIGKAGRASEKILAKKLGSRPRPASGAMEGAKGDVDLKTVLLEAKSSTGASISVKHAWLSKIAHEARSEGKSPALAVSFVTGDGRPVREGEWVMIPMWLWREKCLD